MSKEQWEIDMLAEPIVPAWSETAHCGTNGAELQRAILRGFSDDKRDPVWDPDPKEFTFTKEFNFKEHGEFFRGALTMAGLRHARDFYELLERHGKIKVTIRKFKKELSE